MDDNQNTSETVANEHQTIIDESETVVSDESNTESATAESTEANDVADQTPQEIESPQVQIEKLAEALAAAKEQTLRGAAEMQNLRKRAERDVESAHKFGQEKLITSLLPVLDNLDRAIDTAKKEGEEAKLPAAVIAMLEGIELTQKSALDVLKRFSVDVIEPYGEPFDPQLHEAMTMVPSDTAEPNSVIDVLQKGYALNGRLLRAAMVVVAKP